jgi:hypothetical protein
LPALSDDGTPLGEGGFQARRNLSRRDLGVGATNTTDVTTTNSNKGQRQMWLFTKQGFFSAVQNFNDSNLIHVRARFKGDLERLCATYGVEPQVVNLPNTDYPFRMDFERGKWAEIVKSEAESIDYSNFKNAVHDGTRRDEAYMDVWSAMQEYQD